MDSIPTWILVSQGIISIGQAVLQSVQLTMMVRLMRNITNGEWLLEQARKWGIFFDEKLIHYANMIYNYFIQILEGTLFTPEIIDGIMNRLYILVGIFIFFKLCILAIRYITEPEQFLDAKVGGEKLIKRILIGSVVIIALPLIFSTAMRIQTAIIKDNVIGKILLPDYIYSEINNDKENTGKRLGMMILGGFFTWDERIPKEQAIEVYNNYDRVVRYNDISLFNQKKINKKVNDIYVYSYVPIISTLAIGYFLLTLIRYALEVAVRSIKLSFLQVIAPFSIVKYMLDPADNDSLKKWLNATISTYILIFVRMFTLWFIAMMAWYLKNGVPSSDGTTTSLISSSSDELLKALIVIALFAFLKELPKLISDLFGYNLQDNETIDGVLKQATGVVKGLALGKVGLEVQKPMMAVGMAAQGAGAVAGGLGTAAKAYNQTDAKSKTGQMASAITSGIGAAGIQGFGSSTGMFANAISSNFGNTQIAPLTKGTGSTVQTQYVPDFKERYGQSEAEREKLEKQRKDKEIADNIFQSNEVKNYFDSDNKVLNISGKGEAARDAFVKAINDQLIKDNVIKQGEELTKEEIGKAVLNVTADPSNIDASSMINIYNSCLSTIEGKEIARRELDVSNTFDGTNSNVQIQTPPVQTQIQTPSTQTQTPPIQTQTPPTQTQAPPTNNNNQTS